MSKVTPDRIQKEVDQELAKATKKFAIFNSAHEGFSVIKEEVDELWHEVKHGTVKRQRAEAIQVAAMALRFIRDVCDAPKDGRK